MLVVGTDAVFNVAVETAAVAETEEDGSLVASFPPLLLQDAKNNEEEGLTLRVGQSFRSLLSAAHETMRTNEEEKQGIQSKKSRRRRVLRGANQTTGGSWCIRYSVCCNCLVRTGHRRHEMIFLSLGHHG